MSSQDTSRDYTEKEIRKRAHDGIRNRKVHFYKPDGDGFVNYAGRTNDSKLLYTEVIADELSKDENWNTFVEHIDNTESYRTTDFKQNHTGTIDDISDDPTVTEKRIAIALFNAFKGTPLGYLGRILDYEVPLNSTQADALGDVDLAAWNEEDKVIRLIELKSGKNTETLLRALLEIFTYYKLINLSFETVRTEYDLPQAKEFRPVILAGPGTRAAKTIGDLQKDPNMMPNLRKLIAKMNARMGSQVEFYILNGPGDSPDDKQDKCLENNNGKLQLTGEVTVEQVHLDNL